MRKFSLSPDANENKVFLLSRGELGTQWSPIFYNKERLKYIEIFSSSKYDFEISKLKYIVEISSQKSTASQVDKYIGMANIESNTGIYVKSETEKGKGDCSVFKTDDVLFGKLRPYLNKVYLAEFDGGCTTEFVVLDTIDKEKISNKFLSIFLLLDCVVNQTKYMMTGNTLPRLQTFDIENLLIPIPLKDTQQTIIGIMDVAYETKKTKEEKAKELLKSIDDYLLRELGITLPYYPSSDLVERVFELDFSVVFGTRLDCLSHKPFYEDAINAIKKSSKNYSYELLRDLITHSISGDWGDDEKNITNFDDYTQCLVLRSTEIDNTYGLNIDGERKKYRYLKNTKLDRLNTRVNDILIEKSGGSPDQPVGRVALLTQEIFENDVIAFSNFIHKIRLNEKIQAEFAFNCLRTFYNKKITENMQSQTNGIRNLIMNEFLHIPMPLPKPEIQEQISKEIKLRRDEAKKLQNEAKELLDQAKKEVEKIILGEIK